MISAALLALAAFFADPPPLPTGPVPPVRPRANLVAVFAGEAYPREALRRREQGAVGYRLVVRADGRVGRCDVIASSGSRSLDAATCRILRRRAIFAPARDGAGRPVADVVASQVRWSLPAPSALASYVSWRDYPREAIRRREQGRVAFELIVGTDGRVSECRILESSGSAALDGRTCQIMRERPSFPPPRDAAGQLATDTVRGAIFWVLPRRPLIPLNPATGEPPRLAGRGYER
jgi:TonB family protein